jgi:hypothetical protein
MNFILTKETILPTPFGKVTLPALETPPMSLPSMPDEHAKKAIMHGVGEDLAQIIGIVPWVGAVVEDALEDMHQAEIRKMLTSEEYNKFSEYNKTLPTSLALARLFMFKKV